MPTTVDRVLSKMSDGGAHPVELAAMRRRLAQLADPASGDVPGSVLSPVQDLPRLVELPDVGGEDARRVLDQFAVVKLNGGLGTSMGLTGPKSLLEVKPGHSFLDVIAQQVLSLRAKSGSRLPLLLMNSSSTRPASLAALARYPDLADQPMPLDFLQGREPKLRADTGEPVEWPADPDLEWCPPGHGDVYPALTASGVRDQLLAAGVRWCFISNADNLGALVDVRLAAWIAAEQVSFVMEAVRGTAADRKGGHLACRDGHMIVRETAQVPAGDDSFTDIDRWRFYNTNNLWIDLQVLEDMQTADPAAPTLPLIVNRKTVDPRDKTSPEVIQLETAMGAAIGSIPGARAVEVPRSRFAPVKTTNDLLVVRSDAYELTEAGDMLPSFDGPGPVVTLDDAFYKYLPDLEAHFPDGAPSLRACSTLTIKGEVTFGADVIVDGGVQLVGPRAIPSRTVLSATS